ncbi:methyl-accepting chemotaxis protein [Oryzomonas sagensis]|uniref:Methyl-accepting chemotaxis protein n=1 Tax=Oryzomonas sagensis TaxID=2603857 RepID=A0ABQ6TNW7_9BACT|nr:methyl-accepting chemotaxis protein [Oryzomonas sagensis]KAB0670336.1 methyl-accepting chemotaxis protein [Oryzomonas sagensis]
MLSDLKISARLALGFSVMLLIMAVISGIALNGFTRINDKVHVITDNRWQKTVAIHVIKDNTNLITRLMRDAIISEDPATLKNGLEQIKKAKKENAGFFEKLDKTIVDGEDKALLQAIKTSKTSYNAAQNEIFELLDANNKAEAGKLLLTKLQPLQNDYLDSLNKMIDFQAREMGKAGDAVEATYRSAQLEIIIVVVASLLAAALIGFVTARSIILPLGHAVKVNRSIADGDLKVSVVVDRKDEIGQLNESAKHMIENLHNIISRLSNTSAQVAAASGQLHSTAERIASGSEEVAVQVGTVATAGEEMSATSGDIARNCQLAAEGAQRASQSAENGAAVVEKTVAVMGQIAEKVQESARTVESLGARSDQIGAIIGTIEDIADQTNLLALNAAIEAARAGEQGRGFAVVADEVRALAERTTRATREIDEMIKAIQSETKGAVSAMEQGVNQVEAGTMEAARSGEALRDILEQVNDVAMQVGQIATAAEQQTATTSEISSNMQQITAVVQETSLGAQESATASAQLRGNAEELQRLVQQFRL